MRDPNLPSAYQEEAENIGRCLAAADSIADRDMAELRRVLAGHARMRSSCQQGRQRCENYLASLSRHLPAVSVNHVWYMIHALQQDFDAALAEEKK